MAQASTIATTRKDYREGTQQYIAGGFIFLSFPGMAESFTVPYSDDYSDGQMYAAVAESVLGGVFVNARFRFIR